jgi:meso-butanediol dehydrogenase / (S,S)-butanediol dehydrogenase / diacetyl reductase
MGSLNGKRAVITGGASGIGAASARIFAREGARVCLLDRDLEAAEHLAGELGSDHFAVSVDVASQESVAAAFGAVDLRFETVDVLLASAGVLATGDAVATEPEEWQRVIDVNLNGSFYSSQEAARRMIAAGVDGSITLVASVAGLIAMPRRAAYISSKAGLIGLTRSLAMDLGPEGIRVNAICPGMARTPLTEAYFTDPAPQPGLTETIPLGRAGEAAEIGEAAAFLAGDRASYVSGVALPVDGGLAASRPMTASVAEAERDVS